MVIFAYFGRSHSPCPSATCSSHLDSNPKSLLFAFSLSALLAILHPVLRPHISVSQHPCTYTHNLTRAALSLSFSVSPPSFSALLSYHSPLAVLTPDACRCHPTSPWEFSPIPPFIASPILVSIITTFFHPVKTTLSYSTSPVSRRFYPVSCPQPPSGRR